MIKSFFQSKGGAFCLAAMSLFMISGGLSEYMPNQALLLLSWGLVGSIVLVVLGIAWGLNHSEEQTSWFILVFPWLVWLLLMVFYSQSQLDTTGFGWIFVILGGLFGLLSLSAFTQNKKGALASASGVPLVQTHNSHDHNAHIGDDNHSHDNHSH